MSDTTEKKEKNGPIQNEKKGSCREYEGERVKAREIERERWRREYKSLLGFLVGWFESESSFLETCVISTKRCWSGSIILILCSRVLKISSIKQCAPTCNQNA